MTFLTLSQRENCSLQAEGTWPLEVTSIIKGQAQDVTASSSGLRNRVQWSMSVSARELRPKCECQNSASWRWCLSGRTKAQDSRGCSSVWGARGASYGAGWPCQVNSARGTNGTLNYTLPLDSHWVQTIHGKEMRPGKGLSLVETVSLLECNRETSAAHTLSPKRGEDDVWA